MKRSFSAALGGATLGLIVAMSFGVTMGTLHSFTGFSHAVRPGSKATLCGESAATGIAWTEALSLITIPAGAFLVWQKAHQSPVG